MHSSVRGGGLDLLGINRRWTNKGSPSLSVVIGESVWLGVLDDEGRWMLVCRAFRTAEYVELSQNKSPEGKTYWVFTMSIHCCS